VIPHASDAARQEQLAPIDPAALLLTIPETSRLLHLQQASIYRLLKDGRLRGLKLGRTRRVLRSSVEALIADGAEGGEPTPIRTTSREERMRDAQRRAARRSNRPV
jgi:excisionase family DNA binding protein